MASSTSLRVYYVLRGYPGLGRVMGGVSIHQTLADTLGDVYEGRFASYLAGHRYLERAGYSVLDLFPRGFHPRPNAYLNPLGAESRLLAADLEAFRPDSVIVDGEPFCVPWMKDVLGHRITVLANPADFENPSSDSLGIELFRYYFGQADQVLVHGLESLPDHVTTDLEARTNLWQMNTLVRPVIYWEGKRRTRQEDPAPGRHIVCILGGGTENVAPEFVESTVQIGVRTVLAAKTIPGARMTMFCGNGLVKSRILSAIESLPSGFTLIEELPDSCDALLSADLVVARSGRNLISELLTLGTKGVVIPVNGESYRAGEQRRNAELAGGGRRAPKLATVDDDLDAFVQQVEFLLEQPRERPQWTPGNEDLAQVIESWPEREGRQNGP